MAGRIEEYGLIGDTHTAALAGTSGSIDWLCVPRFDSSACFAALLGDAENGRWLIAPEGGHKSGVQRYRDSTLVLETEFALEDGSRAAVIDFMPWPPREGAERVDLIRIVEGRRGTAPMRMEAVFRFDYGRIVPWVRREEYGIRVIAGPDALRLRTPVALRGEDFRTVASFTVKEGQRVPFVLTWYPSHLEPPEEIEAEEALERTEAKWREWSSQCSVEGEWCELRVRSLITLKALTYSPTGGIVAAPTMSLPEAIGGVRNWDYRYCWLRDSTFTLYALLNAGYTEEAQKWRAWLLRAIAGEPGELQIMYGLAGQRRLSEYEVSWLRGYELSSPVRVGNAAHRQFQLDVYGEVMDTLELAREDVGFGGDDEWRIQQLLISSLESLWREPDEGIWEVRGPRRHFVHSKVMAWVAADRAVKAVERHHLKGDVANWRKLRAAIHREVCEKGYDRKRNTFVQSYGSEALDAALLMIPMVGFLPASDERVKGTVRAIEEQLMTDGLVQRYRQDEKEIDGLPGEEGAFLPCSFWLADNYALLGREADARALYERLIGLCTPLGLLSEEYNPKARRLLGNFPQAFTHVGLLNTAQNLVAARGPAKRRSNHHKN